MHFFLIIVIQPCLGTLFNILILLFVKSNIYVLTLSVLISLSLSLSVHSDYYITCVEKDIQMRTPFQDVGDFEVIFTECSDILCYLLL